VDEFKHTMKFDVRAEEEINEAQMVLREVYEALQQKGYNPINQLVGYLLSGDPAYITSYNNARSTVLKLERDDLLEEMVRFYLDGKLEKER
jgi:uncharacterized protein (UPF0297 family)